MSDSGLHIVVTGGHSGIGLELTRKLVAEGHTVGIVVRSRARLESLPADLRAQLQTWEADLADQTQVARVAEEIASTWPKVDVLFNNAGVLLGELQTSPQGNELHLEVNALAPYLLTRRLGGALRKAKHPVVVNTVTSNMHKSTLDLSEIIEPKRFRRLVGAYMQSKLALTLLMNDLSEDPQWSDVEIRSVNPGPNNTGMTGGNNKDGMPRWLLPFAKLLFAKPTRGAGLLYDGAFGESHRGVSGVFVDGKRSKKVRHVLSESEKEALLGGLQVPAVEP